MEHALALAGLTYADLGRHRWYRGRIASVTQLGRHRLLQLRETSRNGSPLKVWVSSVALEDVLAGDWADLLDIEPLPELNVHVRGRFVFCDGTDGLTADIHYPENISVRRCNASVAC